MEEGKKRLATLVGCNYPNTPHELHGCINDVHAMREVLVRRFGFHPRDVEVLTDAPRSKVLPTGANIRRALATMVDRAQPGDVLFFHYSGHGTWFPSTGKRAGDGRQRDEAIVPCDFNLITDVDFRHLVNRLPEGASFTIISDSCHSGGLIDKEKEQIGPSSVLPTAAKDSSSQVDKAISFESLLAHLTFLSGIDSPHVGEHLSGLFGAEGVSAKFAAAFERGKMPLADEGILLSGCQANETSADMCQGKDTGRAYGAFSNAIQMVLKEQEGLVSNRELVTRAREVLRRQGFSQHPCLYSSDENTDATFLWQRPRPRSTM
ncbi:hypothetical protein Taro_033298 [Colocasia esculenta]|uniref:Peptidase C14 caspase domain-containing protein n=1 Tax=Colocasia esculenta TaxID=4460 RepID=A0A843VTI3_COLES|nr:hypothetical protein [Colocasia esculenta]